MAWGLAWASSWYALVRYFHLDDYGMYSATVRDQHAVMAAVPVASVLCEFLAAPLSKLASAIAGTATLGVVVGIGFGRYIDLFAYDGPDVTVLAAKLVMLICAVRCLVVAVGVPPSSPAGWLLAGILVYSLFAIDQGLGLRGVKGLNPSSLLFWLWSFAWVKLLVLVGPSIALPARIRCLVGSER